MKDKIVVFLSRPNPYTYEQNNFLEKLKVYLLSYDIETITLQAAEYDLSDSIAFLNNMIKKCYGTIIVGFRQIHIANGTKKPNAIQDDIFFQPKEEDLENTFLTSPFCHIEGTISLIYNMPLLIINEEGVREEAIIKGGRFSIKTQKINLSSEKSYFDDSLFKKEISIWIGEVTRNFFFLKQHKI